MTHLHDLFQLIVKELKYRMLYVPMLEIYNGSVDT